MIDAELRDHPDRGVSVVLDPDGLLALSPDLGEVREARDWAELRSVYEIAGRRRSAAGRLVIHVHDPECQTPRDLPWDIGRRARTVVARFPWPRRHLALWRNLDDDGRVRLGDLLSRDRDPSGAEILDALFEVSLPTNDPAAEFAAVIRLRLSDAVPATAWSFVRPLVGGRLASALAAEPPRLEELQAAWDDWLQRGTGSPEHWLLHEAGPSLAALHAFGLLHGARRAAPDLPAWVAIGTAQLPPAERVRQLLEQAPTSPGASGGLATGPRSRLGGARCAHRWPRLPHPASSPTPRGRHGRPLTPTLSLGSRHTWVRSTPARAPSPRPLSASRPFSPDASGPWGIFRRTEGQTVVQHELADSGNPAQSGGSHHGDVRRAAGSSMAAGRCWLRR